MISMIKKYKAFGIGAILVLIAFLTLEYSGIIVPAKDALLETTLISVFWWLSISLALHNMSLIKNKKRVLIKILSLFVILFMLFGVDTYFDTPDNPFSIFLIVAFWLGMLYLFFPKFFIKYKWPLLIIYGVLLLYFFYVRNDENYQTFYRQRAFNLLLLPVFLICIVWLYEQWKWFRRLKSEKTKAELELLKTQVNPHFLFNTLNNLHALTVKKSDKAPEVILKLSDMLRYTIYDGQLDHVSISDEIAYLKNYITLHEIRHHKNVRINFEHSHLPDDKVSPLLFIILLENAFKHGVEKLEKDAYVDIKLESNKKHILFSITNNYDPLIQSSDKGIGLKNLKKRLAFLYPGKHNLAIEKTASEYKLELILEKQ